jgi:hypothetical protein
VFGLEGRAFEFHHVTLQAGLIEKQIDEKLSSTPWLSFVSIVLFFAI